MFDQELENILSLPILERLQLAMAESIATISACTGTIPLSSILINKSRSANTVSCYWLTNGIQVASKCIDIEGDSNPLQEAISHMDAHAKHLVASMADGEWDDIIEFPASKAYLVAWNDSSDIYWLPAATCPNWDEGNDLLTQLFQLFTRRWSDFLMQNDYQSNQDTWNKILYKAVGNTNQFIEQAAANTVTKLFNKTKTENSTTFISFIKSISSFPYEGRKCNGSLCVLNDNIQDPCAVTMRFSAPLEFALCSVRELRKLLEMTNDSHALIIQNGLILGIGDPRLGNATITFSGNGNWSLSTPQRKPVFTCSSGDIRLTNSKESINLQHMLCGEFSNHCSVKAIEDIISIVCNQRHGTGVIISDIAQQECARLSAAERCIQITPLFLPKCNRDFLLSLTQIDGAILLDPYGTCYAIGVIVDGEAIVKGSSARGARYNALTNYAAWQKRQFESRCLAIIISEDGSIDYSYQQSEMEKLLLSFG